MSEVNAVMVKRLSAVVMFVTVAAGSCAYAGSGTDACGREESRLRSLESDQCSGWSYVLNPSACFNTRKALAPYTSGKCRTLAGPEGPNGNQAEPESIKTEPLKAVSPPSVPSGGGAAAVDSVGAQRPTPPASAVTAGSSSELAALRREVAALRSEVERLRAELVRLREGR